MKKRLFRNLLVLGLLLVALTVMLSAATFNGLFYKEADPSSNIDWDKAPAEQINDRYILLQYMPLQYYCDRPGLPQNNTDRHSVSGGQ